MAEPILFTLEAPADAKVPFMGTKPQIENVDFNDSPDYDQIVRFIDRLECLTDAKGDPSGKKQHPIEFWKTANINTPFFKECCHRSLLIPKISFHFFHKLKGDGDMINFMTIELEQILIVSNTIEMYDSTVPHDPEKNILSEASKPYLEKVKLSGQTIRWKYQRGEPLAADHGTEYKLL